MSNSHLPLYERRTGVSERPASFVEVRTKTVSKFTAAVRRKVSTNTFFCDISEFQPVVTSRYPHPMIAFRADNGWRTDNHARPNWNFIRHSPDIHVAIAYVVYIPGQLDAVMHRLKQLFGDTCPKKLVLMIDMESGQGFAGPGNHSTDANRWVAAFVKWTGSRNRVLAYGNYYDFQWCWPELPSWVRRVTAGYGGNDPGSYGWQYFGGFQQYGSPVGYPRSCAPFGSWVDINVIHRSIDEIIVDLGVSALPIGTTTHPKPTPVSTTTGKTHGYVVRRGDTLSAIAAHHGVTLAGLLRLNPQFKAHPNAIRIGQVVRLPGSASPGKPTTPSGAKHYRIASGDTLAGIAKRHDTTVSHLVKLNSSLIKNPNLIRVGWVIRVA